MKETFQIYLNSVDALVGSSSPNRCEFDLSAIVPNVTTDRCRVRVSYFDIYVASSAWKTAAVSTILIRVPGTATPHSFESTPTADQGVGRMLVQNSQIIGVCPTGNDAGVTFSQSSNNQFVEVGDIFHGYFTVELVNEDRGSLSSVLNASSKGWSMVLDVEIEDRCGCHT